MLLKDVQDDIAFYKHRLMRRAKKTGICENFGLRETKALEEKYAGYKCVNDGIWAEIKMFSNWCRKYTGK
tara:strand:+ start:28813 stop:29022 length:210 start_codon:yes stop_codon:yes gene_type:complete